MFSWHAIPIARLLLAFAAGIAANHYTKPASYFSGFLLLIVPAAACYLYQRAGLSFKLKYKLMPGLLLSLMYFGLALLLSFEERPENRPLHYSRTFRPDDALLVQLPENPELKRQYYTTYAGVLGVVDKSGLYRPAEGKIMLRIERDITNRAPYAGNLYLINPDLQKPAGALYPGDFDYRAYLRHKQVMHIAKVKSGHWVWIREAGMNLSIVCANIRENILNTLRTHIPDKQNAGIAEALLLGYRAHVSEETNAAFRDTGTLHILSVSGLHVGLVFTLLGFLSRFMLNRKGGVYLRTGIMLAGLWAYSAISGLSPSVVRAAVMFSLVSCGQTFGRQSNPFNSVYASALLMLSMDTGLFFDTGFQLSYAAVLGIIFLYPKLKNLYQPRNKPARHLRDMVMVSLAAQVFTLPLSLYYFSQFPVYFLLYNLLLMPLFSLALFMAIALAALSFSETAASLCGGLLDGVLGIGRQILLDSRDTPGAVITNLYTDIGDMMLLYAALFAIIGFTLMRKGYWAVLFLGIVTCWQFVSLTKRLRQDSDGRISVISLHGGTAFLCSAGDSAYLLCDHYFASKTESLRSAEAYAFRKGIRHLKVRPLSASFVETNLKVVKRMGFQFFDKIMTINNPNALHADKVINNTKGRLHDNLNKQKSNRYKQLYFNILNINHTNNKLWTPSHDKACSRTCRSKRLMVF